jgi:hypothetical protein
MVGINNQGTNDFGIDPGYTKNVASCTSWNGSVDGEPVLFSIGTQDYYEGVREVIDNAYPCYSCNITFKIANGGTIPAHFKSLEHEYVSGNPLLCGCVELGGWWLWDQYGDMTSGDNLTSLETQLKTLQLHGGDNVTLKIEKHLLQTCDMGCGEYEMPQGANCTMLHRMKWVQFNKVNED